MDGSLLMCWLLPNSFRFKTYLYTPVVDESILQAIRSADNGLVVLGKDRKGCLIIR